MITVLGFIFLGLIALNIVILGLIGLLRSSYYRGYHQGQCDSAYPPTTSVREVIAMAEFFTAEAARGRRAR